MDDQNQFRNGGFDQESGTYHYSYIPQYNPAPSAPEEPPRQKKSRTPAGASL